MRRPTSMLRFEISSKHYFLSHISSKMLRLFCLFLLVCCCSAAAVLHQYEGQQLYTWRSSQGRNPWVPRFSTSLTSGSLGQVIVSGVSDFPPNIAHWFPKTMFDRGQRLYAPHIVYNNVSSFWPNPRRDGFSTLLPTGLILHPGSAGQYAHLVFVAPARSTYIIQVDFFAASKGASIDAHMLVKGIEFWSADINAEEDGSLYYVPHRFSLSVALNQNDEIDFAVGYGSNGAYVSDWGGINAKIQATF
mmetsp:Transcript_28982/g.46884  ORF Transcript_28982/g.46884 Transcript_28982/m.46884 type:complete len:247 (+) Transcript_28982:102-842(+)